MSGAAISGGRCSMPTPTGAACCRSRSATRSHFPNPTGPSPRRGLAEGWQRVGIGLASGLAWARVGAGIGAGLPHLVFDTLGGLRARTLAGEAAPERPSPAPAPAPAGSGSGRTGSARTWVGKDWAAKTWAAKTGSGRAGLAVAEPSQTRSRQTIIVHSPGRRAAQPVLCASGAVRMQRFGKAVLWKTALRAGSALE